MAGSLFRLSMLRLYRITVNYGNSSLGPLRVQFHIEFCWRSDGLNWDGTLLHCCEMGYIWTRFCVNLSLSSFLCPVLNLKPIWRDDCWGCVTWWETFSHKRILKTHPWLIWVSIVRSWIIVDAIYRARSLFGLRVLRFLRVAANYRNVSRDATYAVSLSI